MKVKKELLLFFVSILFLAPACNNEELADNSLQEEVEELDEIDQEIQYLKFIEELQAEYPDKTIYHHYNMPDFSEEIDTQLTNCVELPPIQEETALTRASHVTYGPYGGTGGAAFDIPMVLYSGEKWKRLQSVLVSYDTKAYVNSLQLVWVNNLGQSSRSAQYGETAGVVSGFSMKSNEYITGVNLKYGRLVDNITFITNFNVYVFGGPGGKAPTYVNHNFGPSKLQMHGLYGRSGRVIDRIGFYCYPDSMFP